MGSARRRLRAFVAALAFCLLAAAGLFAELVPAFGRTVLALYKSTEGQSARDNEIASFVEPALRDLGFAVSYYDVDSGIPDAAALREARAVVSWFRGPSMGSPERYLAFVRDTIDSGRKFIVLDNLGAYQERGSGRWLESGELNLTLSRFGIQYWGDWTDDPALVSLRSADADVFHKEALVAAGMRLLYYRFVTVDRDLEVLLSVERRDRSTGPSPVAVANRNGAFVLSSYIAAYRNNAQELYVDFPALLRRALFGRAREDRVAILTDAAGPEPPAVSLAERVLGAGKIGADVLGAEVLRLLVPGDLTRYTTVALALATPDGVEDRVLADFLAQGGSVVGLSDVVPESVRRLVSVLPPEGKAPEPAEAKGLRVSSGFVTSEGFFFEDRDVSWTAGTLRPAPGATLLVTDWLDATPLLWSVRTPAGGAVLVWNARELWRAEHAGLLMESLLASRAAAGCVTLALAAFRLDGFPRPLYNAVQKPLAVTDTEFFTRRFWPDLRDLLSKRGIPASVSVVFNYNDRTSSPFWGGEMYVADGQATVGQVRELIASGAEVGLFGYNHVSLATSPIAPNTRAWPSRQAMEEALRTVREDWKLLFGPQTLPQSYAAPYGIISDDGLAALRAVFPEIRVVGTGIGGGSLGATGFARVPNGEGVRVEPAATSGYLYTDQTRRLLMNSVLGDGVWIHALDADSVLDPAANAGKKWEGLLAELDRVLSFQARHYPWLRFVRVSELAQELDRAEQVRARFELRPTTGGVTTYVVEVTPSSLIRLRASGLRIQNVEGGEVLYTYARADAAVIRARSGRVVITLVRKA